MVPDGSTVPESGSRLRTASSWVALLVVLVALWLWTTFSSGGWLPRQWLLPFLVLGLVGLAISSAALYPRRPRQLSLLVLGLFGLFTIWAALSTTWADSPTAAWLESSRLFGYLAVFAIAASLMTHTVARRVFRYLLMGAAFFILVACIWRLWASDDLGALFIANRLAYPVAFPNGAAALFLLGFWPLIWLASGTEERAPVRGVALGIATGLLGLAIMTQSRGAVWSLAISAVIMFVVCPARLRTLFYLFVPGLLMVYEFPNLNRFWVGGVETAGNGPAARTLLVASLTAGFIGMILALLERWVKVSRRMKAIFGSVILAGVIAALVYGAIAVTSDTGGPFKWLSQTWQRFTATSVAVSSATEAEAPSESRFTLVGSSGRTEVWRVAWREFEADPGTGVGAGNFAIHYDRLRTVEVSRPAYPHSLVLQVLAETGVVGGVLFIASLLIAFGGLLWPRCTAGWRRVRSSWLRPGRPVSDRMCNPRWGAGPQSYGWQMALFAALAYWFIHGSVDMLWQTAAVSIPAFVFLAAGLGEVDARVDAIWPRLSSLLKASVARHARGSEWRRKDPLSVGFRVALMVLSVLLVVFSLLPYVTVRLQESALHLAATDGRRAVDRAQTAHWFLSFDPGPYVAQATVYETAAREAAASGRSDRRGAVLDDLALAVEASEKAVWREPAGWSVHHRAGLATLNLLLATRHSGVLSSYIPSTDMTPAVEGLHDWSALADAAEALRAGESAGSLATDDTKRATAHRFRSLSQRQLAEVALGHLRAALERNPLSAQTKTAMALVGELMGP